jgi:hypothetical protein
MAGPERIEWRPSAPSRPLTALGWYMAGAVMVVALVFLLFGSEPARLGSGVVNPLADLPMWTVALAAVGATPFVLTLFRRPVVAANHYALTVRPGWVRTLVLPWARVAEVAVADVRGDGYLLVRCGSGLDRLGNRPQWIDRAVLRGAVRHDARLGHQYDVAVRMRDFVGSTDGRLAALAAFAPDHVVVAIQLDRA